MCSNRCLKVVHTCYRTRFERRRSRRYCEALSSLDGAADAIARAAHCRGAGVALNAVPLLGAGLPRSAGPPRSSSPKFPEPSGPGEPCELEPGPEPGSGLESGVTASVDAASLASLVVPAATEVDAGVGIGGGKVGAGDTPYWLGGSGDTPDWVGGLGDTPDWLERAGAGAASVPDYLAAVVSYIAAVGDLLAASDVTAGGGSGSMSLKPQIQI